MLNKQLQLIDGHELRAKFTIEETNDRFIVTSWFPDECLEVDREVEEFETYSMALSVMYQRAFETSLQYSHLKVK